MVSFLTPGIIIYYNFNSSPPEIKVNKIAIHLNYLINIFSFFSIFKILNEVKIKGFKSEDFIAKQVFYDSKDGTAKIPMFIMHHKVCSNYISFNKIFFQKNIEIFLEIEI
jgi:hypothetical protein